MALMIAAILVCFAIPARSADGPTTDEYEIKATMMANVLRLVEWPAGKGGDANAPLVLGIVNSDEMLWAFRKLTAKAQAGHPIVVRKLASGADIEGCQALFLGGSDPKRLDLFIHAAGSRPILTVGESRQSMVLGGMVGLLMKDDHVEVEVNLPAAQSAGLSISSRLLRIAVKPARGGNS